MLNGYGLAFAVVTQLRPPPGDDLIYRATDQESSVLSTSTEPCSIWGQAPGPIASIARWSSDWSSEWCRVAIAGALRLRSGDPLRAFRGGGEDAVASFPQRSFR
jgi:hypothetical protein